MNALPHHRSLLGDKRSVQTARLKISELTVDDAAFILQLLNEPSFLLYIGDKGVRTEADARAFLVSGPMAGYEHQGFALYRVALRTTGQPIGLCGLLKRDNMPHPDLGFAFMPEFWSQGYAFESAQKILDLARDVPEFNTILAVTAPDNQASIALLARLGFVFKRKLDDFGDADESNLYAIELQEN